MAIIEGLINWRMDVPKLFGIFHITFLFICVAITTLLIIFFRDSNAKTMKRIVLISWIIMVVLEVAKQLMLSYEMGYWQYVWEQFPFQFCETPMYIMPFILFIKNEKIKNAILSFMSTYVFFAGFALMILPITLFSSSVLLNIRTMIQHGIQVMLGLYLFAWNRKNITMRSVIHGSIIFIGTVVLALILNAIIGIKHPEVNMFYLSRENPSIIFIVKEIKPYVPYPIFLLAYIIGFSLCAFASYVVINFVYKLISQRKLTAEQQTEVEN